MNTYPASRRSAIMDMILLSVCWIVILFLLGILSSTIFMMEGVFTIEMASIWIFFGVSAYFFYICIVADNKLIELTGHNYRHAIKVCQTWLKLSRLSIIFGLILLGVILVLKLHCPKSIPEEFAKSVILFMVFVFITQRTVGVYFVSKYKLDMEKAIPIYLTEETMIYPSITNPSIRPIYDTPPKYTDVVKSSAYDPPPPYSATLTSSNNWI